MELHNQHVNSALIDHAMLSFATDAEGAGGGSASAGPFATSGDLATGENDATSRQAFDFSSVTARYVALTVMDNFFVAPGDGSVEGTLAGGDRVGLGEVAFQSSVPEPSSMVLVLLGSLVAFATRRRQR